MTDNTRHIISSFKWQTTFNDKSRGIEVQERLSNWSRYSMPRTVSTVFNSMCPREQVWRIPALEIDLGKIDILDMEAAIALKLKNKLQEKLYSLILHPQDNNLVVDFQDNNTSYLQLVTAFLLQGYLPWTYKAENGNINDIVATLLHNNYDEVILTLHNIGSKHEYVRKRMAWQLHEGNKKFLIKGFEPDYHEEIIEFSEELTNIQSKNNVVKAGTNDFKKHIWFWIFNYLLTPGGTLYNRLAFAKSSLTQMAAHYNIAYEVLLDILLKAIHIVSKNNPVKTNFLQTITQLGSEQVSQEGKYSKASEKVNFKADVNGGNILYIIQKQNQEEFTALIEKAIADEEKWQLLYTKLDNASLHKVLTKYATTVLNTSSVKVIDLLIRVCYELKVAVPYREIFKLIAKNKSRNTNDFLTGFYTILGRQANANQSQLSAQLLNAKTLAKSKSTYSLQLYSHLLKTISENRKTLLLLNKKDIEKAIYIAHNITLPAVDRTTFESLKHNIEKSCMLQPEKMLALLSGVRQHYNLQWLSVYTGTESILKLLTTANSQAFAKVTEILNTATTVSLEKQFLLFIEEYLPVAALEVIITNKGYDSKKFTITLLQKLHKNLAIKQQQSFTLLTEQLYKDTFIDKIAFEAIESFCKTKAKTAPLLKIKQLLQSHGNEKVAISKILTENFNKKEVAAVRRPGNVLGEAIINYLLRNGSRLLIRFTKEYAPILTANLKNKTREEIHTILNQIFWKCLLEFSYHRGDISIFTHNFKLAVQLHFPVKITDRFTIKNKILPENKQQSVLLQNGHYISAGILITLLQRGLKDTSVTLTYKGKELQFSEVITAAVAFIPDEVYKIIRSSNNPEKSIIQLSKIFDFDTFSYSLLPACPVAIQEKLSIIITLYQVLTKGISGSLKKKIEQLYWKVSWQLFIGKNISLSEIKALVSNTTTLLAKEVPDINIYITNNITKRQGSLQRPVQQLLSAYTPVIITKQSKGMLRLSSMLQKYRRTGLLYTITANIITKRQLPPTLLTGETNDISQLVNALLTAYPEVVIKVLQKECIPENQIEWLHQNIDFEQFIAGISKLYTHQESNLLLLQQFYYGLGNIRINGVTTKQLKKLLFRKLIKALQSGNWKIITAGELWNELFWDCKIKYGVAPQKIIRHLKENVTWLPPALLVSFRQAEDNYAKPRALTGNKVLTKENDLPENISRMNQQKSEEAREVIPVKNAGLVLLNNYFSMLFDRLGIIENRQFINAEKQEAAVHYLQYIVTGHNHTDEYLVMLNKVLCGLPLSTPVPDGIVIPDNEKQTINSLIKAAIDYWPAIGETSVQGFRGNWLVRDGLLSETEDRWELTVEKRAYDLLIHKSPFSFSIIKYPWMDKPLHVNWNY